MGALDSVARWPVLESLSRVALALAVGLFVGLEREWRGKEAGLRTFGFASLLGALGGLLGPPFALAAVGGTFVLVLILNWSSIGSASGIELTTSAALMVVAFTGVICGQGHRVTPAAVAVITAALLAWKERMATFSHRLTAEELRSAILLGILAFAVYPVLPAYAVDPWGLVVPRAAFVAVLLISALGFVNYVLWKLLGPTGLAATGFLGGLVNSTVTVAEFAQRTRQSPEVAEPAVRAVTLATLAMLLRNATLLGLLDLPALRATWPAFGLLTLGAFIQTLRPPRLGAGPIQGVELPLQSPFSLRGALKYGALFLVLAIAGELARRLFGSLGLYAVSLGGGLVSSASSVGSAASLGAHGQVSPLVVGHAAALASLASVAVNAVLIWRGAGSRALSLAVLRVVVILLACGALGLVVSARFGNLLGLAD